MFINRKFILGVLMFTGVTESMLTSDFGVDPAVARNERHTPAAGYSPMRLGNSPGFQHRIHLGD